MSSCLEKRRRKTDLKALEIDDLHIARNKIAEMQ